VQLLRDDLRDLELLVQNTDTVRTHLRQPSAKRVFESVMSGSTDTDRQTQPLKRNKSEAGGHHTPGTDQSQNLLIANNERSAYICSETHRNHASDHQVVNPHHTGAGENSRSSDAAIPDHKDVEGSRMSEVLVI